MRWAIATLMALALIVGVAVEYRISEIHRKVQQLLMEEEMTQFTTSWESGGTRTVTTTCGEDETLDECIDRHDNEVAAAQLRWPPE